MAIGGQRTVIIGANRGIGLELVKQMALRGDQVVATSRKAEPELNKIDATRVTTVEAVNICDRSSLGPLVEACKGGISTLVVNAGLLEASSDTKKLAEFMDSDFDAFTREWNVNCLGVLRVVALLHEFFEQDAKIILLGTTLSSFEQKDGGLYGYRATKAALHMVGLNLTIELKGKASVAILHPGFVETGMTKPLGFKAGEGGIIDTATSARGIIARIDELNESNSGMSCDYAGTAFNLGGPKHAVAEANRSTTHATPWEAISGALCGCTQAAGGVEGATVVVGGNRGIGLDLVKQLCNRGETVIATSRNAAPQLSNTGATVVEGLDICDAHTIQLLTEACKGIGIATLVVNAGLLEAASDTKKLQELTEDDFQAFTKEWHVNCLGALRVVSTLEKLLMPGAKVVLLGTTLSSFDQKDGGLYGYRATKAALHMVGLNLSIELKGKASVGVIHPGFVETGMTKPLGFQSGEGGIIDTATSAKGIIARIDGLHAERSGVACDYAGEEFAW